MKKMLPFVITLCVAATAFADNRVPTFSELMAHRVSLKRELAGVHPRVFVTADEIAQLRVRARTTHREEWERVLANLPALQSDPPPPPGPQARRSQNNVAFAIAGVSLAYAVERRPEYLEAARTWTLAAIDYEPWGYTYNKPNVDLAAGHLLYAIGWAYDLLYHDLAAVDRERIRASLERHAALVADHFSAREHRQFTFTQNHNYIPTAGLAVAALALIGESSDAPRWAAVARAHHHRANQLLSPDGYIYEGMEYWIFSVPWLVHFYDAWEHSTGESLWELGPARNWKLSMAHAVLPDGQNVFDFGDIWEGPLTRAKQGAEYPRVYPDGRLQSNFNVLYRVASRLRDPETQAVAHRLASFGHSNLEEYWTLVWRDSDLAPAPMTAVPLFHHFEDMGVVYWRSSWDAKATAFAFKAGPPEGHRVGHTLRTLPEWRLDSGHSHPDNGSFIIFARGEYLTGDTGYAGQARAEHHNTITVDELGQGREGDHDVWRTVPYASLDGIRITSAKGDAIGARIEAEIGAAYPPEAGLTRFNRIFEFQGDTFIVTDTIATEHPRRIAWFLHSDTPIVKDVSGALLGAPVPALRASICCAPEGSTISTAPTVVVSPGQPGSITQGERHERGHQLELRTAPATAVRIRAELKIVGD
jgi:hypothetical protein